MITDGLNMVKESVSSLEEKYREDGPKRPRIGAIHESHLEHSSRNLQGSSMAEIEREGEVDEWMPP